MPDHATTPSIRDRAGALAPGRGSAWWAASWPLVAGVVVALLVYFVVAPGIGGLGPNLLVFIAINVLLATSLTVVNGFTGQFSIGHAAFMGVGAYTGASITFYASRAAFGNAMPRGGILSLPAESVIPTLQRIMSENPALLLTGGPGEALLTRGDGIFLGSVLAAAGVAAACGYLVGLPSLRLKGDYLAIVTLGFGEIVRVVLQATGPQARPTVGAAASELTGDTSSMGLAARLLTNVPLGGAQGFNFIPTYASLFWIYLFVTVSLIAMYRIKASSSGRAFLSIREDEIAAQAMGVHVSRAKVRAFVLAAGFAGIAGALASHQSFSITPADFGFQRSFEILIMVVLGGLGSISGAALAAVVLTLLPEALRDPSIFVDAWPAVVGVCVAMAIAGGVLLRVARQQDRVRHLPHALMGGAAALLVLLGVFAVADGLEWNLGKYRLIFYALALILMLMLRPQGLLGVSEVWERGLWRHAFGRRRGGSGSTTSGGAKAGAR